MIVSQKTITVVAMIKMAIVTTNTVHNNCNLQLIIVLLFTVPYNFAYNNNVYK